MKYLQFLIFLIIQCVCSGQLITTPNEIKNGKKEGLWSEYEFLDSINIEGETRLMYGPHFTPLYGIVQGFYIEGERTGIWKSYMIERFLDSNETKYRKGSMKNLVEYVGGYKNGLFISYFNNGSIRLLGHYQKYKYFSMDTLSVTNPDTGITKDTVFISNFSSKMIGNWYEFDIDGRLIKTINYGQHVAWLYRGLTKPVLWAAVHGRAAVPARRAAVGFWLCG